MPHLPLIRKTIAEDLNVELSQVSVKATTSEKLGFVGRQEGVSATVTVLIQKNNNG